MTRVTARPFMKWAGGKTQLLGELANRIPQELRDGRLPVYIEPFVGGGAVFFHFNGLFPFRECHIFDVNEELVLAYRVIQDDPWALIACLGEMESEYLSQDPEGRKAHYYRVRDAFNDGLRTVNPENPGSDGVRRVAELIFLNRTCFNGLFRVNSRGGFNVPFGEHKNPTILNAPLLRAVAASLRNTEVHIGDFSSSLPYVSEQSFVYFDPPYRPLNASSSFTGYASSGFSDGEQQRLAEFFRACDTRGAKLMLSNSDPKNTDPADEFFDHLYAAYRIVRVPAKRMINSNGAKRGEIREIIVTNYDPFYGGQEIKATGQQKLPGFEV